jgi:hypothetical protein
MSERTDNDKLSWRVGDNGELLCHPYEISWDGRCDYQVFKRSTLHTGDPVLLSLGYFCSLREAVDVAERDLVNPIF